MLVRGRRWRIDGLTQAVECAALSLTELAESDPAARMTILTPFDRPVSLDRAPSFRMVRPRRWRHELDRTLVGMRPYGSLSATAATSIRLMPYQLEPALAVLRYGSARVLIADAVGLGKTIQAGVILLELSADIESFRGLVLVPAGLRDQWTTELAARFGLPSIRADAAWLRKTTAEWPADANPWSLPGIYVSSHDFVKRPEVLRPLEDVTWDLVIVDEAHAATAGSDRRVALDAIGCRSRRVILLTATPEAGDPFAFSSLCRIGRIREDEGAVTFFARSRADVDTGRPRKSVLLSVTPSGAERRMHELLHRYSVQVWKEATVRRDDRARLVSIVLRKRALSSAASLAASVQRRMELLAGAPTPLIEQLLLPLGEEDPLADEEPVAALSVPGLADPSRERRWLEAIAEAARAAADSETKMRYLLRLLDRVREPVIVFTEYRDTLARLRRRIAATGRPIAILHGGMTSAERTEVVRLFTNGMLTLLATDAAAEGLNLHHRCRVVVHYELPWNPARLEQRAGRVDRIGQVRRVHEMALVAAATAERLVIAPLAARASRARSRRGGSQLLDALTESRVADAVMSGILPDLQLSGSASRTSSDDAFGMDLRVESEREVRRLERERAFIARSRRGLSSRGGAVVSRLRRVATHTDEGLILVYAVALESNVGRRVHAQPVIVQVLLQRVAIQTVDELRALARLFAVPPDTHLSALLHDTARQSVEEATQLELRKRACVSLRVQAMARDCAAAARRLVQPGLFDRRALRERERRRASSEHTESFLDDTPLRTEISLVAALHLPSRARLP